MGKYIENDNDYNEDDEDDSDTGNFIESENDDDREDTFTDEQRDELLRCVRVVVQQRMSQWNSEERNKSRKTFQDANMSICEENSSVKKNSGKTVETVTKAKQPLQLSLLKSNLKPIPEQRIIMHENNAVHNSFSYEVVTTTTTTTTKRLIVNDMLFNSAGHKPKSFRNSLFGARDLDTTLPKNNSKRRLSFNDGIQSTSKQPKLEIALYDPKKDKSISRKIPNQPEAVMQDCLVKAMRTRSGGTLADLDYTFPCNQIAAEKSKLTYNIGDDTDAQSRSVEMVKNGKEDAFTVFGQQIQSNFLKQFKEL